jgi:diguanylate cyclase (GGDEF)-like protein
MASARDSAGSLAGATSAVNPGVEAPRVLTMQRGVRLRDPLNARRVLSVAGVLLLLHLLGTVLFPRSAAVTCLGLGTSYGVASYVAMRQGRRSLGTMRLRWLMVALGLWVGVLSFVLTLYQASFLRASDGIAGLQDVTLLLRGVPFLIAVSLSKRERSPVFVRLDFAQAILAVCLSFVALLFAFPTPGGGYAPVSSLLAMDRVAAANVLIALASTVRLFASSDLEERRFFRLLCGFLWMNALVTGFVNFEAVRIWQVSPGSPWLALGDLPVLGLAILACLPGGPRPAFQPKSNRGIFAETASSFLFPMWVFLMAASIVPNHLYLGMSCVVLTFLLYGLRSTIVQTRYLAVQEELRDANDRSRDQAMLDGLTGIPNRRSFDVTLSREWKRAKRSGQPLALLMIDIDHFKKLNDAFGHPTGDACLTTLAGLLQTGLGREVDFAARYGGEEFGVLLVDTDVEGARTVAEGLRRTIARHQFTYKDVTAPRMTVSIGIASVVPGSAAWGAMDQVTTLIEMADKALYRAKRRGRNRVEIHEADFEMLEEE